MAVIANPVNGRSRVVALGLLRRTNGFHYMVVDAPLSGTLAQVARIITDIVLIIRRKLFYMDHTVQHTQVRCIY